MAPEKKSRKFDAEGFFEGVRAKLPPAFRAPEPYNSPNTVPFDEDGEIYDIPSQDVAIYSETVGAVLEFQNVPGEPDAAAVSLFDHDMGGGHRPMFITLDPDKWEVVGVKKHEPMGHDDD